VSSRCSDGKRSVPRTESKKNCWLNTPLEVVEKGIVHDGKIVTSAGVPDMAFYLAGQILRGCGPANPA
jgi:hypothetical protein